MTHDDYERLRGQAVSILYRACDAVSCDELGPALAILGGEGQLWLRDVDGMVDPLRLFTTPASPALRRVRP
jgi:hypothetical protein